MKSSARFTKCHKSENRTALPVGWTGWLCQALSFHYCKQHFLYFLPLPHGHGSFLPILGFSYTTVILSEFPIRGCDAKACGFNKYSTSHKSSGSSGSNPPTNIHPFVSQSDATSCNLSSVWTWNLTGLFSVPSFAIELSFLFFRWAQPWHQWRAFQRSTECRCWTIFCLKFYWARWFSIYLFLFWYQEFYNLSLICIWFK